MSDIDFMVNFDQEIYIYDRKIKSYIHTNINKIVGDCNLKLDNIQKQINQLKEDYNIRLDNLQKEINQVNGEIEELKKEEQLLNKGIEEQQKQIIQIEGQIQELNKESNV